MPSLSPACTPAAFCCREVLLTGSPTLDWESLCSILCFSKLPWQVMLTHDRGIPVWRP